MRVIVSLLALLSLCAGCRTATPYVVGAASYTAASSGSSTSGALPLRGVLCGTGEPNEVTLHVGEHCALRGPLQALHRVGTSGSLASRETCILPGAGTDVLTLSAATATFQSLGYTVDTTIGGATADGGYVTYRFVGALAQGPDDACERVEGRRDAGVTDGTTLVAPGREAWETWVPGPQSH